ncbi:uncharacterized protein LOC113351829 [Papaver somniferum]|uniref:uncharacterized protein LOC113351829 n=1 Tax=Papaver somniferum TaxID=3469 RepID=UPI000E6F8E51|nr:uncharacterized protein LOC113351829 [Papaver somniferum]
MTIKAGKWEVHNQVLWIRNWIPDFRPQNHRASQAMIWVHLPGLSLEYWDEATLFTICKALGTPVKVDEATLNFYNGYYARVLVNIDLAGKIPNKLWIKTKFGGFMQNVILTKPPKFCDHCKIVGHLQIECRAKTSSPHEVTKSTVNATPKSTNQSQGMKFDICDPLFCSGNQHKGSAPNNSASEVENCETPIISVGVGHHVNHVNISAGMFGSLQNSSEEENIIEMHKDSVNKVQIVDKKDTSLQGNEIISPTIIQQVAEDNAVESVINFINGKDGSMSEERIPTTS